MRVRRPVHAPLRPLGPGLLASVLLSAALPLSLHAADTCTSPSFDAPVSVPVQAQPFGIVLGDWNRDGKVDFAATNSGSNTVSFRFGNGAGGFGGLAFVASGGTQPEGIAVGDFDDDGAPDIVVANRISGTVNFLQGNGAGGFVLVGASLTGLSGATAVAVGDFDGDGKDDVAVAAFGRNEVVVYLRRGGPFSFSQSSTITTGKEPTALVVGDFDRDGDLDIASASFADGNVSFLQNDGAGNFTEPFGVAGRVAVGFNPTAITAADLDKDGILDLAVAVRGGTSNYIDVLKGAGDGRFGSLGRPAAPGGPVSVAVGDVNNDGNPDLISGANELLVSLGDGTGGFAAARNFGVTGAPAGVAVGDLNGDGREDVALVAQGKDEVDVFLNNSGFPCANVSFGPAARTFAAGAAPRGAARGDFNQDGRLDVAVTNDGTPGSVSVLLANGPGLFASPASYPVGNSPYRVAAGDVNGDGLLDLVVTDFGSNDIAILKGQAGGTFGPATFIPVGTNPVGLVLADLNFDGLPDIVVSNYGADTVSVLLNTGGGFSVPASFTVGLNPASVAVGDVNGDGKPDLVVAVASTSSVIVLLGDGLGGFASGPSVALPAGADPRGLVVADFDGDGYVDAATSNQGLGTVSILVNNLGVFTNTANIAVGSAPLDLASSDLNGDRDTDLVVSNSAGASVAVLLGGPGASFSAPQIYVVPPGPVFLTTGDFTGDGQVDVAVPTTLPPGLTLLVGGGDGTLGVAAEFSTFGFARDIATADFDRDGILDVVIPHQDKGTFSVHLGDGTGKFGPAITYPGTELAAPLHLAAGDFNGDGFLDLAVVQVGKVFIFKGSGSTFSPLFNYDATGTPVGIATADFNHDGKLDLAVALDRGAGNDQVWVYPGLGTGAFGGPIVLDLGASMKPAGITLADFNDNGFVDLAVAHNGADLVSIVLNTSTPGGIISFGLQIIRPAPGKPTALAAGDFRADGHPDLVIATDAGNVLYLDNDPATGFALTTTAWGTSPRPRAIAVEDFNLDGDLDVATASLNTGQVSILLGKGSGTFQNAVNYAVAGAPIGLVTGDFKRDGRPDLASANFNRLTFSVLINTNCQSRRMEVGGPPACNIAGQLFSLQPRLLSLDDGGNLLHCDGSKLTASLLGGPGSLTGTVVENFLIPNGVASYTDLAVDKDGIDYRLLFTHELTPPVIPARSRRFTVGLSVNILPPAPLCPGVPLTFSATPKIFDQYFWTVDAAAPVLGSDQFVVGPQAAGSSHTLQVDAFLGGCPVTQTIPYLINTDLSEVTISVLSGSTIAPFAGTGASLKSSEVGGGVITSHQWSYSATTGGPYTDIPGANLGTYTIKGSDFLAPGIYYLVVTAFTECGTRKTSAELQVIIYTTSAGPGVPFFTATSKNNENTLEWLSPPVPALSVGTLVNYKVSTINTSDCSPPATPADGVVLALVPGLPGTKASFVHTPLLNDTAVCYTAFVYQGGGVFSVTAKQVSGRPFDTSGRVKWAYNVGMLPGAPPGNGIGAIQAAFQDDSLHSMLKGASGGTWPAPWFPLPMNGPSQGRPSTIVPPAPILGASRLIFLGSQGGTVYAINADTGSVAWFNTLPSPAPAPVQAGPSGYFTFFGGTKDHIVVGTRQAGAQNVFYALKLADGTVAWSYDGSANGLQIGVINGQATVDYVNKRVYFASAAFGGSTGQDTVWCLNIETGARIWSVPLGNVMGSPIARNGRLYVASDNAAGEIHALDAATGASVWGGTFATLDGPVKQFVAADRFSTSGRLLFSTTHKVWALDDTGIAPPGAPVWTQDFGPNTPSAPVFQTGGPDVWVGVSDGNLYRLDYASGLPNLSIPLGDPALAAQVGSPTLDLAGGFLYVGTEAGIVYCVQY